MSRYLSPTLQGLVPYTPGDIPRRRSVLKLNTNENPYPPPTPVIEAVRRVADRLQLYPDPNCLKLRQAAAEYYELEPDQIMAGNGSDENLFFALRAFCDAGRPLARPDVTYGCYGVWCGLMHIPQHIIPLEKDFTLDPARYYDLNETIVIANPNAPTGRAISVEEIASILEANRDQVVVIDEAYIDFGGDSCRRLIPQYDNLLVCQTFSKAWSMAGGRLGFALGDPGLISDLEKIKFSTNPYSINRLTQVAAEAALGSADYFAANCRTVAKTRAYTVAELEKLGFETVPSVANFIFTRCPRVPGGTLYRRLKEKGVLVRHWDKPDIADYCRVTIGSRGQMDVFLEKVREILEEESSHA